MSRSAGDRSRAFVARARPLRVLLVAILGTCAGAPAAAQVAGSLAIDSDYRVRGYSLSAGRPVASARVGLDDKSGLYVDGSAIVVLTRDEDARFLGYQADAGIARRVGNDWIVDLGVARNEFRAAYPGGYRYTYSEGYVGATRGPVSAYVFVSPDYYRSGAWTAYGQLEGAFAPARDWTLAAHLGALEFLSTPALSPVRRYLSYDWRLGATRAFGNFEFHVNVSGGGPGRQYYLGETHSRTALVAGGSVGF
jgi:uncharacterized protein (TIGR02001 family)